MKKEYLIVGKWYKNLGIDEMWMAPFVKIHNGNWAKRNNGEYIYAHQYKKDTCLFLTSNFHNATLCTIEELIEYLPKGHPDLITSNQYELWN